MSGQKKLEKACRDKRVIAVPSRKKEVIATDNSGNPIRDKNGKVVTEQVQLYRLHRLH